MGRLAKRRRINVRDGWVVSLKERQVDSCVGSTLTTRVHSFILTPGVQGYTLTTGEHTYTLTTGVHSYTTVTYYLEDLVLHLALPAVQVHAVVPVAVDDDDGLPGRLEAGLPEAGVVSPVHEVRLILSATAEDEETGL